MNGFRVNRLAIATIAFMTTAPALAHEGPGHSHGLASGFAHPFTGLDHLVTIIGVGLLATLGRGKVRWDIPLSFLAFFAVGGLAGMGQPLASIETGVAISVMGVGLWILAQWQGLPRVAVPLSGIFGFLHGWAHGGEQVSGDSGLVFLMGALAASLLLSSASAAIGRYLARFPAGQKAIQRSTGGAILLAGIGVAAS